MAKYGNPVIPEGINVSKEHPLKEFFILAGGIGLATIAVVFLLSLFAEKLAFYIPFEWEHAIAEQAIISGKFATPAYTGEDAQVESYLKTLAQSLAEKQNLPEGMSITLHYSKDDVVNAFATLGGHIIIYKGLIDKLPSENALAMVIAHEIAHIKHRDPIISISRGLTFAAALTALTGTSDDSLAQQLLGNLGMMTVLRFNREQERSADEEALDTLHGHYGHVVGAEALFTALKSEDGVKEPPAFLSTHPITQTRIDRVVQYRADNNDGSELIGLPSYLTNDSGDHQADKVEDE